MRDYRIFFDESTTISSPSSTRDRRSSHGRFAANSAVMRKWWDYMADIMQTARTIRRLAQPLVPVFHLSLSRTADHCGMKETSPCRLSIRIFICGTLQTHHYPWLANPGMSFVGDARELSTII